MCLTILEKKREMMLRLAHIGMLEEREVGPALFEVETKIKNIRTRFHNHL
jgi:hypothetical protein